MPMPSSDTGDVVATLRGHDASIKSLSLDTSGRLLLAVSSKDSVLWDLNSFSRFKTLNGGQEIGVQDVRTQHQFCSPFYYLHFLIHYMYLSIAFLFTFSYFSLHFLFTFNLHFHHYSLFLLHGSLPILLLKVFFLPFSDTILTCFKDDSIHAWELDSLEYKYLLPTTPGPSPHYRAFATSQDGKVLVGGGRSALLHMWNMETRSLTRIIQLPSKVRHVKQLFFLVEPCDAGASEVLGVLAQDGILRLINIHTCKLVFQMGSSDQVHVASPLAPPIQLLPL